MEAPKLCYSCFKPISEGTGRTYELVPKSVHLPPALHEVPLHHSCTGRFEEEHFTVRTL